MKISAVIITGNEEHNIADAIRSLEWADELLVIDSESTDRTAEIAGSLGARVIVRPWNGFSEQKQFGVNEAKNDWIYSLDADERVSAELSREILQIKDHKMNEAAAYKMRRLTYYMGRAIRYSGWYPDWQVRLFDRRKARWSDAPVHESVKVDDGSSPVALKGEILHYTVDNARRHHQKIGERYAPLAARQMFDRGITTSRLRIISAGPIGFLSAYFLKRGFMDGLAGFCIARFAGHYAFMKHLCLWELQQMNKPDQRQL
jgi:glycosyltransferase involved in cell wall biosynthesis